MSTFLVGADETDAAPIDAALVADDITALPDGGTYYLVGEPDDTVSINLTDGKNRIIDGGGLSFPTNSGKLHFNVTNTGSGTITFVNMKLTNPNGYGSSGGISVTGGNYVFENCSFIGLTNAAVRFNGNSNSADFTDCTFKNNTARGISFSSGTAVRQAEFNVERCYFDGNTLVNGRGAALQSGSTHFNLKIHDSLFTNNRAVGTSTGSGGNNGVDGGAVAVNANNGDPAIVLTVKLDIWDCYFEENFAQDDGGAVLVEGAITSQKIISSIWNCTFIGNKAAGASYFGTYLGITAGVTNGSGGAISYYGLTDSSVTNCTFYNNGITNEYTGPGTNCGNAGGGGAIGVDTTDSITDPSLLPPAPVLSNNIFIGNYVKKNTNFISPLVSSTFGAVRATPYTGNVFVMTGADADRQDPLVIARPITNNGNVGYDNGNNIFDTANSGNFSIIIPVTRFADDLGIDVQSGMTVENIFVNVSGGVPVKETLGSPVGATGESGQRYYYMPSPRSDELYRDGSGPYYDSALTTVDTLGNPRDVFPSAGAVEIYWTKFNPGDEGDWSVVPIQIDNPSDVTRPYFVVQSMKFSTNGMYYVVTDVGLPSPEIAAMPRSALTPDDPEYGFVGWRSSQPDLDWWDAAWATANGVAETNVPDFLLAHAVSELPPAAFPLYQPGQLVPSTKQVLTAEWSVKEYRVDFSLNYADPPAHPDPIHNYWLPDPADITQGGYESAPGTVVPPYTNVPFGDHIYQPKADPLRAGYVFGGWYKEPGLVSAWNFATDAINGDTVLYAKWGVACYVMYYDTGADSGAAPVDTNNPYPAGSTVTVLGQETLSRAGFAFAGWSTTRDGSSPAYAQGNTFVITENMDLYPVWTPLGGSGGSKMFYIHSDADGGSSIDPLGTVTVRGGGNATFVFKAKPGYEISAIMINGISRAELIGAGSYTFSNVRSDHRISVVSILPEEGDVVPPVEADGDGWGVLNLVLAAIALMAGIIGVAAGRNRTAEDKERRSKTAAALRTLGLVLGVISIIVFILTEDWTLPVAVTDRWTLLMLVLFIAAVASSLVSFRFDEADEDDRSNKRI
ncbi:MAG: InlB B-repeat-containing protein [Candidatus Methanoplasma sp.]|jgi:uncharacterized repeat protein (TIGR02543 family)|nr:InlB B-repeat-containing protein [Candidatus Methanoplasma sp.]